MIRARKGFVKIASFVTARKFHKTSSLTELGLAETPQYTSKFNNTTSKTIEDRLENIIFTC